MRSGLSWDPNSGAPQEERAGNSNHSICSGTEESLDSGLGSRMERPGATRRCLGRDSALSLPGL